MDSVWGHSQKPGLDFSLQHSGAGRASVKSTAQWRVRREASSSSFCELCDRAFCISPKNTYCPLCLCCLFPSLEIIAERMSGLLRKCVSNAARYRIWTWCAEKYPQTDLWVEHSQETHHRSVGCCFLSVRPHSEREKKEKGFLGVRVESYLTPPLLLPSSSKNTGIILDFSSPLVKKQTYVRQIQSVSHCFRGKLNLSWYCSS